MRRFASRAAWVVYLTAGLSLLVIAPAAAYIDPGTGSMVFQAIIAAVIAIPVAIAAFWSRITGFFSRRKR